MERKGDAMEGLFSIPHTNTKGHSSKPACVVQTKLFLPAFEFIPAYIYIYSSCTMLMEISVSIGH